CFGYVPDPASVYRSALKLRPGHTLTVGRSGVRHRRYWTPVFSEQAASFENTVEEIRALAADAVKRRMIADVPLGAFLSGGVDSSAVAGLMTEYSPIPVKTFSIGFPVPEFDELAYARQTAGRHNTDHHEEVVMPRVEEIFDTLVSAYDEPFGDASALP